MKCPICQKEGKKSCVYEGITTSTCIYCQPYYDEEGKYHVHDLNNHTTSYNCSNGHSWTKRRRGWCPTCGDEANWK